MNKKRYLFLCKHNFTRSRYAEDFLRGYLDAKNVKAIISSAGVGWLSVFLGRRINKNILKNVDVVFVMEKYMKNYLVKNFEFARKKIIVMNIKDEYGFLRRKSYLALEKRFEKFDWKKYI